VRVTAERPGDLVSGDVADIVVSRSTSLAAWNALPEPDRELLALVAWGELSPAEAAKVIDCSKAAFLVRLHRARRRFEATLRHDGEASEVAPVVPVSSLLSIPKEPLR
jgi:RNA polymerase sigma-70 factor (ECF subfamily)